MQQDIPGQRQGPDTGGVYISSNEIYRTVLQVSGKMDVLITQTSEQSRQVHDHESRIRSVEASRWPLPTLSVLIALATFLYVVLGK